MREEQLTELLHSLTIEEKIGQLVQLSSDFYTDDEALKVGPQQKLGISDKVVELSGSVLNVAGAENVKRIQKAYLEKSRHKIPLLFMADVVYGYKTIYPIPLGIGATWNPEMIRRGYEKTAAEAKAAVVHVTFSPMVDVVRDARWGRCLESTGEDTWLNSRFSEAMVKGFQGEHLDQEQGIAACVKHYAAYGAPEAGREYNTVDMSQRRLREEYLPPYRAAVDAGCEMVMTSFNTVDEIPATGNKWLMDEVLRKEWGFDGVVITDYAAIAELIAHGVAEDEKEASYLAMEAGVDIDMKTSCYANSLAPLIEEGRISVDKLDAAVMRILRLKNKLGLFEDPYRGADEAEEQRIFCCEEHREYARRTAEESMVLLENKNDVLPLESPDGEKARIALIGPYSDTRAMIGLWAIHADMKDVVTLKEALEKAYSAENVITEKGCDFLSDASSLGSFGRVGEGDMTNDTPVPDSRILKERALEAAKSSDVVILAMGEHPMQSGEGGSRTEPVLPDIQMDLLKEISALGKPIVLVVFGGRPLVLTEVRKYVDAVLEAWYPGTEGGHAIADILLGKVNPSGRLPMSFPYSIGQIPVYYNGFNTGRPAKDSTHSGRFTSRYLDCPNEPLYPFGYGLSYHKVTYSDLVLDRKEMARDEKIKVSVEVTNTSNIGGIETVQMYLRDITGSVVRPVKELRGFQKVALEAGERKKVEFEITEELLKFHTKDMTFAAEPGRFLVMIGPNSEENKSTEFVLTES